MRVLGYWRVRSAAVPSASSERNIASASGRGVFFVPAECPFSSLHRSFGLIRQPIKFRLERKAVRFKREIILLARH